MFAGRRRYRKNISFSIASQMVLGLAAAMLGLACVFYFTLAGANLPYYKAGEIRTVQLVNELTDSIAVGSDLQASLLLAHQLVLRSNKSYQIARAKTANVKIRATSSLPSQLSNVRAIYSDPLLWAILDPGQQTQNKLPSNVNEIALSLSLAEKLFGSGASAIGQTVVLDKQPYSVVYVTNKDFVPPVQFVNALKNSEEHFALAVADFSAQQQQLLDKDKSAKLLLLLRSNDADEQITQELRSVISPLVGDSKVVNIRVKPLVDYMKGSGDSLALILLIAASVLAISVLAGASMSYFSSASSRSREHFVLLSIGAPGQKRFLIDDIELAIQILMALVFAIVLISIGGWFISSMLALNARAIWGLYVLAISISVIYLSCSMVVLVVQSRLALRLRNITRNSNVRHGQLNKKTRFIQRFVLSLVILVGLIAATISQGFLQTGMDAFATTKNKDYSDLYSLQLMLDGRLSQGKIVGELGLLKQRFVDLPGVQSVAFSQADPIDFMGAGVAYSGSRNMREYKIAYDQSGQKYYYRTEDVDDNSEDKVSYFLTYVGVERDLFGMLQIPLLDGKLWEEGDTGKILLTRLALIAIHGREGVGYEQAIPAGPPSDEGEFKRWDYTLQATGIIEEPRVKSPEYINNFGNFPLVFAPWRGPLRVGTTGKEHNWMLHVVFKTLPNTTIQKSQIDKLLQSLSTPVALSKLTSLKEMVDRRVRQHKINALGVIVLVFGILFSIGLAAFGMLRFIYQVSQNEIGVRLALGMTDRKLIFMLLYREMWPLVTILVLWMFLLGLADFLAAIVGITGIPGVGSGLIASALILFSVGMAFVLAIKEPLSQPPSYLMRVE